MGEASWQSGALSVAQTLAATRDRGPRHARPDGSSRREVDTEASARLPSARIPTFVVAAPWPDVRAAARPSEVPGLDESTDSRFLLAPPDHAENPARQKTVCCIGNRFLTVWEALNLWEVPPGEPIPPR